MKKLICNNCLKEYEDQGWEHNELGYCCEECMIVDDSSELDLY